MRIPLIKSMVIIIAVSIFSTSCSSEETIRIGVVGTMSGVDSDLSVSGRRGVELAVSEINQKGGIDGKIVEIVIKDDLNKVEQALKVSRELIAEDIRLIIGPFTSGMVMGVIDYINSEEVLMLGPTISADVLSSRDDNFIRFMDSTRAQAEVLTDFIQTNGEKRVMVVYDQTNKGYVNGLIDDFEALLKEKTNLDAKIIAYNPKDIEKFKETISEIVYYNPDGLFIVSSAEESARMARNIKLELENVQLYGSLWSNTPELLRKGGTAVEGMVLVEGMELEDKSQAFLDFKKSFFDQFGEWPTFASIYSYEAMMALALAIESSKSTNPGLVKAEILRISKFDGVQEDYVVDVYGDNSRSYKVYKVESGNYRKVD